MSYEKAYEGGFRSGEAGGTPITPESLNHMEEGIAAACENRTEAGTVIMAGQANRTVEQRVTFTKPFESRPTVVVSANTASPHQVYASPYAVDTGGFTIVLYRPNAVSTTVEWEAVGQ